MGDPWRHKGLPGSPRDPEHEKRKRRWRRFWGRIRLFWEVAAPQARNQEFKNTKNFRSGTGREIDLNNTSGTLRARAAAEKHKEEAGAGPGARFLKLRT